MPSTSTRLCCRLDLATLPTVLDRDLCRACRRRRRRLQAGTCRGCGQALSTDAAVDHGCCARCVDPAHHLHPLY